ncbi:hypothetical protein [Alcaligenes aquatilis]|nr:hypothetical protein [Alcaligenes aquatilis]
MIKRTFIAAALLSTCTITPTSAFAYIKCDVSDVCAETSRQQGQQTRQRIFDMEHSLVKVILESVERLLGGLREQTGALTASEAQNTQASGKNTQKVQQAAEITTENRRRAPMACPATSTAQAPYKPRIGGNGFDPKPFKLSKQSTDSIAANRTTIPPTNLAYARANVGVGGCLDFSEPNSPLGQLCKKAGVPSAGQSEYKDADVLSSTLFDGPRGFPSVPGFGPERDARIANLNLLFNGSPVETPRDDALSRVQNAAPYLGLLREYRAAKNLAEYEPRHYDVLTTTDPNTRFALEAIRSEYPSFYAEYFRDVETKNGVSIAALLELQVESRAGNKEWFKKMSAATPEEKQNEQLAIQALSLRIQHQQLQQMQRLSIAQSKALDLLIESTLRSQLDQQIEQMSVSSARGAAQDHK